MRGHHFRHQHMREGIIQFQCMNCGAILKAPLCYSGHYAPCPSCGSTVLATAGREIMNPSISTTYQPSSNSIESMSAAMDTLGDSYPASNQHSDHNECSALRPRILPDQCISFMDLERKENRKLIRMIIFAAFVFGIMLSIYWLSKSLLNH